VHIFAPASNPNVSVQLTKLLGGYEFAEGLHVHRSPSCPYFPLTRFPSLLKILSAAGSEADVLISEFHPFHCAGFEGIITKALTKKPLILDVHDIAASQATLFQLYKKNENFCYNACDGLVVCSDEAKEYANEITKKEIHVVPNGVNFKSYANVKKEETQKLRKDLGLEDSLVIGFSGSLTKQNGLEYLIRAMPYVLKEVNDVKLLIVGGGAEEQRLRSMVKELGIESKVVFTGGVSYEKVPTYLSVMDICTAPFPRGNEFKTNFPLKLVEYMACGKPIVVTEGPVLRRIVTSSKSGIVVDSEDEVSLANGITRLLSSDSLRKQLGEKGRHYAAGFDWDILADKMYSFIKRFG